MTSPTRGTHSLDTRCDSRRFIDSVDGVLDADPHKDSVFRPAELRKFNMVEACEGMLPEVLFFEGK
jgi:hypothetical protein